MQIVIAGGTGFLGGPLAAVYAEDGHDVRVLTRRLPDGEGRHDSGTGVPGITQVGWKPDGRSGPWAAVLDGADAVINLSGEGIGDRRWTPQRKAQLRDSRVIPTRSLVAALASVRVRPPVFVSGSAVGYYGASGGEAITESSPAGDDFLAHLCEDWEAEARAAATHGLRVVCMRTGIVLGAGGALAKMALPFRFFVGGPIGSGRQWVPWIHITDAARAYLAAATDERYTGPINLVADSVRNAMLSRAIGQTLHRPSWLPVPGFALRVALGEFADYALHGRRVVPARLHELGFTWNHPDLTAALSSD